MAAFFRRRFRWKNGQVVVELPDDEQDMLRHVLPQLRELVMGETDPALRRLSPPARPDDPDAEAFYRQMVTDELLVSRLEAIEVVEEGIAGTVLDDAGIAKGKKLLGKKLLRGVVTLRSEMGFKARAGDPQTKAGVAKEKTEKADKDKTDKAADNKDKAADKERQRRRQNLLMLKKWHSIHFQNKMKKKQL